MFLVAGRNRQKREPRWKARQESERSGRVVSGLPFEQQSGLVESRKSRNDRDARFSLVRLAKVFDRPRDRGGARVR